MKKMLEKTNKFVIFWIVLLCFVPLAAIFFKTTTAMPYQSSKPSPLSDWISVSARMTPRDRMIDENTMFVRAEAYNSHTIAYYYDLINYDMQPAGFDLKATKREAIKAVCDSQKTKANSILAMGGTYLLIYKSKNVKEIGRFEINNQVCNAFP